MTITNSEVNGNTAQGRGGGIYITNGHLVLDHSEVNDNTLDGPRDGGGIFSSSALESPPAVQIIDSTVARNTTGRSGGGYFDNQNTNHDSLLIKQSTFNDNEAVGRRRWPSHPDGRDDRELDDRQQPRPEPTAAGSGWSTRTSTSQRHDQRQRRRRPGRRASPRPRRRERRRLLPQQHDRRQQRLQRRGERQQPDHGGVQRGHEQPRQRDELRLPGRQQQPEQLQSRPRRRCRTTADRRSRAPSVSQQRRARCRRRAVCAASPVDGIDQRHVPRPQGAACDIGAYELAATIRGMKFEDLDPVGPRMRLIRARGLDHQRLCRRRRGR